MFLNYVITDSNMIKSFDPLEADDNDNMPVMRMLYTTPLEINEKGIIVSNVFEKFEYDESINQISFKFRPGLFFEDGTPITLKDVLVSILRMAYFRPCFPVLRDIIGIQAWANEKKGLSTSPKGIVVEDNVITIKLTKSHRNPLFRFCLELFSIIPVRYLNLLTGEMTSASPPASGYYRIEKKSETEITFLKRDLPRAVQEVVYNKINFKFLSIDEAVSVLNCPRTIVVSSETNFVCSKRRNEIDSRQMQWTPSSFFAFLAYNPNLEPFNSQETRSYFSMRTRQALKESNLGFTVESSIFTNILPGYLSSIELEQEDGELSRLFEGKIFKLYKFSNSKMEPLFNAIIQAARALKMELKIISDPPVDCLIDDFLEGEYNLVFANSCFWELDPVGDLSMFFSKNLHKLLSFSWCEKELYEKLEILEDEIESKMIDLKMIEINKWINQRSLVSPIIHFKRLYLTSPDIRSLDIPAITVPTAWQLHLK